MLSKILYFVATVQLLHAGWSTYEFNQVSKITYVPYPKDIPYELACCGILYVLAIFTSFSKLNLLTHYTNKSVTVDQYLHDIKMSRAMKIDSIAEGDPFSYVNKSRVYFDIVAKRNEFKKWFDTKEKEN